MEWIAVAIACVAMFCLPRERHQSRNLRAMDAIGRGCIGALTVLVVDHTWWHVLLFTVLFACAWVVFDKDHWPKEVV